MRDNLNIGDLIRGNGRRMQGREMLRIVSLNGDYAICDIPGRGEDNHDNLIQIGRVHIHTDGLERRIGWDRVARGIKVSDLGRVLKAPTAGAPACA